MTYTFRKVSKAAHNNYNNSIKAPHKTCTTKNTVCDKKAHTTRNERRSCENRAIPSFARVSSFLQRKLTMRDLWQYSCFSLSCLK